MRRHTERKHYLLVCVILGAMGVLGCRWDSSPYRDFVNEDAEGELSVKKCPSEGDGTLGYIEYENAGTIMVCDSDKCRSDSNCCDLADEDQSRMFRRSFEFDICPVGYRCAQSIETEAYYCTSTTELDCGKTNEVQCGDRCFDIKTSLMHCGGCNQKCTPEELDREYSLGNSQTESVKCENAHCSAVDCKKGFHKVALDDSVNEEDKIFVCVSDNATSCNGINCTELAGCMAEDSETSDISETGESTDTEIVQSKGVCDCRDDNLCYAIQCEQGYHISNKNGVPCVADTDKKCGENEIDCTKISDEDRALGISERICKNAQCVISACDSNHHFDESNTECIENSETACGSYNNDCTQLTGWGSGSCNEGQCDAKTCAEKYHLYELDENISRCELDSVVACGSHDNNCNSLLSESIGSMKCENGKCVVNFCNPKFHLKENSECDESGTNCGMICVGDSPTACGSEQYNCEKLTGVKEASCDKPFQCVATQCVDGFHLYEGECELDSVSNCGAHEHTCTGNEFCVKAEPGAGGEGGEGVTAVCTTTCTSGLTVCGSDCVDTKSNIQHCGGCDGEDSVVRNCTAKYPNASVTCADSNCVLIGCNLDYHLGDEGCVHDSVTECGDSKLNCNESPNSKEQAVMVCENAACTYHTCITGYADCDGNPDNGCETNLERFGLTVNNGKCVCQSNYTACGNTRDGINRPLCLKQGKLYHNYIRRDSIGSCNNNGFDYLTLNGVDYCYDPCLNRSCSTNLQSKVRLLKYGQQHTYFQLTNENSDVWSSSIYEWNEAHCAEACNSSYNGKLFYSSDTSESWGHQDCRPKSECDMLDSVEINNNRSKHYVDYGCILHNSN